MSQVSLNLTTHSIPYRAKQKDINDLEHWRLFFISLLHNNGKGKKYREFKDYSPFTSLTYGSKKVPLSRNFALNRTKHKSGFIYITVVDTRKKYFIKTHDLISELSKFGVQWYEDTHRECMVVNGIFPHHILGIMEVTRTRTPRMIVNPWLYKEYVEDRAYNVAHGITINQEHFHDFINNDKFNRYFYENYKGNQYVSEINQSSTKKVNTFK